MKFTAERDKLQEAVASVIGRTKNSTIPILSHVLIEAAGDKVRVTGHDVDACMTVEIAAEVDGSASTAMPADRLHRLLSGLPKGAQIAVSADDREATIKCGRSNYKFFVLPAHDFPEPLMPHDPVSVDLTAEQALRLLKVPAPCISTEQARPYLGGINLAHHNKAIAACATNGHTLIEVRQTIECDAFEPVIVPKSAAADMVELAKASGCTLEIATNVIVASADGRRFASKLIDGTFPDYSRVIPQKDGAPMIVGAAEADAALARLMAACDPQRTPVVRLSWKDGELTGELKTDFGMGIEAIECDVPEREPGNIGSQIEYVREMIGAAGSKTVEFYIAGPSDPMRIESPTHGDFVGVIMPCRY